MIRAFIRIKWRWKHLQQCLEFGSAVECGVVVQG